MTGFSPIPFEELYHKLLVSGAAVGHQNTDMQIEDNLYTRGVLKDYGIHVTEPHGRNTETGWRANALRSNIDGAPYLEVPFIFNAKAPEAVFNDLLQAKAGMSSAVSGAYNVFHHVREIEKSVNNRNVDVRGFDQLAENISQMQPATSADTQKQRSIASTALGLVSISLATLMAHGRPAAEEIFEKVCRRTHQNYKDDPEMMKAVDQAKGDFLIGTAELTPHDIMESLPDASDESEKKADVDFSPKPPGME